jgi:hypothetical protein
MQCCLLVPLVIRKRGSHNRTTDPYDYYLSILLLSNTIHTQHRALAETAYEDTYLTILDVDGSEWADNLRVKMQPNQEGPLPTEQSWLMDRMV